MYIYIFQSVFYVLRSSFFFCGRESKKRGLARGQSHNKRNAGFGGAGFGRRWARYFYLCFFALQRIMSCKPATPLSGTRVASPISTNFSCPVHVKSPRGRESGGRWSIFLVFLISIFWSETCEYRVIYFQVVKFGPFMHNASISIYLGLNEPNGLYG